MFFFYPKNVRTKSFKYFDEWKFMDSEKFQFFKSSC